MALHGADWAKITKLFVIGLVFASLALALPVCLRALDSRVVLHAGHETLTLKREAQNQYSLEKPGIAELLLQGAQKCGIEDLAEAQAAYDQFRIDHPELNFWGGHFPNLDNVPVADLTQKASVVKALVAPQTRSVIIERLKSSRRPGVQEILENRDLLQTELFPPVSAPGGAALETIITAIALLSQDDFLQPEFRLELERLASDANRGHSTRPLELAYLDVLAFAGKLDWAQFSGFLSKIDRLETLSRLTRALKQNDQDLPILFSIVWLAPSAKEVSDYLHRWPETGIADLTLGLRSHRGGVESVLQRGDRVYSPPRFNQWFFELWPQLARSLIADMSYHFPRLSLLFKYLAILFGSFYLIRMVAVFLPQTKNRVKVIQMEKITFVRQEILAVLLLIVAILASEPFLAQSDQIEDNSPNWKFPTAPEAIVGEVHAMLGENVNEIDLLVLVIFFLIQVLLFALCRVKLREIEKHRGSSRLKLKLLDNEDNMFDSGLYVGLAGTVLALVMVTIELVSVSLMAAYSSTLFGIVFTCLLKIIYIRPYRRKLLIETEAGIL